MARFWQRLKEPLQRSGILHPDFIELCAYQDGEIERTRAAVIAEHLRRCSACRVEFDWIADCLESCASASQTTPEIPLLNAGLERLLRIIHDEGLLARELDRLRNERNCSVVAELATYFGSYPSVLLERSIDEGFPFEEEVSRLVRSFLGKSSAAALLC